MAALPVKLKRILLRCELWQLERTLGKKVLLGQIMPRLKGPRVQNIYAESLSVAKEERICLHKGKNLSILHSRSWGKHSKIYGL